MKKLLLLFISVLCLGLGAYAETVSFASGLPSDWTKLNGTISNQTRVSVKCLQLQKEAAIQSPEYKNVSSVKVKLNISSNATTFTIAQSTDNGSSWKTIKTVAKADCSPDSWSEFEANTDGDTSTGVIFKLTSAAASYYISTFEYNTSGGSATTAPEAPVVKFGETTCTAGETYDIESGAEVTVSSKDAESIIANSPVEAEAEAEHTGNSYKFKISKSGDYTFKGKNKVGESATTTVTFNVKKPVGSGIEYVIVSSEDQLVAGEYYAIASLSKGKAMSTVSNTDARQSVDVNIIEGKFDQTDDVLNFLLGGKKDAWTLKTTNYSGKNTGLSFTSDKTDLKIVKTATTCAIAIAENGDAMITLPKAKQGRRIKLSGSGTNFKFYAATHSDTANVQLYRETVVAPTIEVDGKTISTVGSVDVEAGAVIRIIGHEANELYYIHTYTTTANRAPVANTEGWTKHGSNIYEYTVPADFDTKHITITAKGVKNGKESAPVSITLHNGSTTGIEGVESAENDAEVEWFTITGVRVQQPAEGGLYIRRQGSEVSKVRF